MMPGHDIIVIGASAGGVEAFSQLARHLPEDLPAAIFVVLHVPAHGTSWLPQHPQPPRAAAGAASGRWARRSSPGGSTSRRRISICCWSRTGSGCRGARGRTGIGRRWTRCSARRRGRSARGSSAWCSRAPWTTGRAGLAAIKRRGGVATIVQDPDEALYPSMPRNALEAVAVDHRLPVAGIAEVLGRLARDRSRTRRETIPCRTISTRRAGSRHSTWMPSRTRIGRASRRSSAARTAAGALWELQEGELVRFRCRVGHAWTANGLLAEQSEGIETALWTACGAGGAPCSASGSPSGCPSGGSTPPRPASQQQSGDSRRRAAILRQVLVSEPTHQRRARTGARDDRRRRPSIRGRWAGWITPPPPPSAFDVVALVASAGGLPALTEMPRRGTQGGPPGCTRFRPSSLWRNSTQLGFETSPGGTTPIVDR